LPLGVITPSDEETYVSNSAVNLPSIAGGERREILLLPKKDAQGQKALRDVLAPRSGGEVPMHKAPWRGGTESDSFRLFPGMNDLGSTVFPLWPVA
jgi:hypothetical protein